MKCSSPYCKNKARKGRTICHSCESRKKREKNPMRAAFEALRFNSRRRGKKFDITFEQFKEFCYETAYMAGKGRTKQSFTVDCEINELGYTYGNLRNRSKSINSSKGKKKLIYDWEHPEYAYVASY